MPYHTSRSAIKAGRSCRRLRYNQYHALGTGLVPGGKISVDLLVGTAMHTAAEHLLKGGDPAGAVIAALESLDLEAQWMRSNGVPFDCREETLRLIELMTHLFARVAMPQVCEKYDVSEVESDSSHTLTWVGEEGVELEIKPDAKLRNVATDEIGAFSLKTISKYAPWVAQRDQMELQNFTEPWAVGGTFVQMCYVVKGSKGRDGIAYDNSLLYPYWHRENDHWSWAYNYVGRDGKAHKLGKGWERVPIWEHMSIPTWLNMIDALHSPDATWDWHRVKPYDKWIILPLPVGRGQAQIERQMTVLMNEERSHFANLVELGDRENDREALDQLFPAEGTDCATPSHVCPYFTACLSDWTPAQMRQFGFVPRTPHHAGELAAMEDSDV